MRATEYTLPCAVSRPVRIALVTDLHEYDPEPVLAILRRLRPDVIAVAGDTMERHSRGENLDREDTSLSSRLICRGIRAMEILAGPRSPGAVSRAHSRRFFLEGSRIAPMVLCRGNHELYLTDEDRAVLAQAHVQLLENTAVSLAGIRFGGIPSRQISKTLDRGFLEAFAAAPGVRVLLCHHPEYYPELAPYGLDLILSGHCHGGQIRVLGRGVFAPGQGLLPKYHHGVYHGHLVVSAGCANTAPIPRWGNEPEVVLLHLTPADPTIEKRNRHG